MNASNETPNTVVAELSPLDKLRANAELVVRTIRDTLHVELGFDQAGIEWIDGYINRMREPLPANERPGLISTLGSYVGECIIRTFGGAWVEKDGAWIVQVNDRVLVNPFGKVHKQIENGDEDSVALLFKLIPKLVQE